jgi:hypothetical protein
MCISPALCKIYATTVKSAKYNSCSVMTFGINHNCCQASTIPGDWNMAIACERLPKQIISAQLSVHYPTQA